MAKEPVPSNLVLRLSAVCKRADLTIQQLATIVAIAERGGSADFGELAKQLGAFKPTMTRYVDKAQELGFIRRSGVADDKRKVTLSLTTEGRKFLRSNLPADLLTA